MRILEKPSRSAATRSLAPGSLASRLRTLYGQVPATGCGQTGECCALTHEEAAQGYATMYPLYRAEFSHIAVHLEQAVAPARRRELQSCTEERPRRCPFLGPDRACTIYPVRPLICRTYGVMTPQTIAAASARHEGRVPAAWIRGFARREAGMLCPRVRVLEPEKLERHAQRLITGAYERVLRRLSLRTELAAPERWRLFREHTGQRAWPVRWSWGGFSAVRWAPLAWLREEFPAYWHQAYLVDRE